MVEFGLIGFPLGHSWSPKWFNDKFRQEGKTNKEYRLFPLTRVDNFPALLMQEQNLSGLNVTTPYKEKIIPYLDDLDQTAREIGAVNTIKIFREGKRVHTKGFNTDAPGFEQTLNAIPANLKALIIGTGGASRAVAFVLGKKDIPFTIVSRSPKGKDVISFQEMDRNLLAEHLLIINATPLGMLPASEQFPPIPYHLLTPEHWLYDLIYNPSQTTFLQKGKSAGANTINGYQMLVNQAVLSYEIFMKAGW